MKIKSKKAISRDFLLKLIIFLATLIVLIAFTAKETGIISLHSSETGCELSAIKSSETGKTRLNCPRKVIVIEENKIIADKEIIKSGKITEDDIKKTIADEMADCWKKFGKGNLRVFETSMIKDNAVCSICAEIHFKKMPKKEIAGFEDYLKEKTTPKKYSKKEISYYSFMTKEQKDKYIFGTIPWTQWTPWGTSKESIYLNKKIDTAEDYAVVYKEFVPSTVNIKTGAESRARYIILKSFDELENCCCDYIYE